MEPYISKSALLAEIERRRESNAKEKFFGRLVEDNYFLDFLDTLEVKEVDLDKELNKYFITNNLIAADIQFEPVTQMEKCAKYFFELGLKESNPLTWQDVKLLSEIGEDFMNSRKSDSLSEEEYYQEILKRFKAQKGE